MPQRVLDQPRCPRSGERPQLNQEDTMRTKGAALGAAVAALAAATATPVTTGAFNSADREPPRIMLDPTADNTDVYAFTRRTRPAR